MKARYLIFFWFVTLFPLAVPAQQNEFNFTNFSSKDGLSSNIVNAILKDRFGYMWFATDDGLSKFDGVNFTVYRHNSADSTSIGGNEVMTLHEDRSGNLWVGSKGILSLYDRKKNAFTNFRIFSNTVIRSVFSGRDGFVWAGSFAGLFRIDPKTRKFTSFTADPAKPGQLVTNLVLSVFEGRDRRLWVGTNAGLYEYKPRTRNFRRYVHDPKDSSSLPDNVIRVINEDQHGNVWFGTNEGGLAVLRSGEKGFKTYRQERSANSLSNNRVHAIAPDKSGKLWIGTENGLNIFDPGSGNWTRVFSDPRNKFSLLGKSVRSIFIDNHGIYWVGTYQGGVNKYDKNLTFFNLRESNGLDLSGLNSPVVTSFAEGNKGEIFVGTDGGGLNLYRRELGLFSHPSVTAADGTSPHSILALERASGQLWIATYQQGLFSLDLGSGSVKHFLAGPGAGQLTNNDIFCLKEDRNGELWIGTNGGGVTIYNPRSGLFRRFERKKGVPKPMTDGYIRVIEEDENGTMWIGSVDGIVVYERSSGTFTTLNKNNNLPLNSVQAICITKNGTVWAGSPEGLSRLDPARNRFTTFAERDGLASAFIYKILEDNSGKLWVSTNKGISSFNPETLKFKNFSYYNGLQRSTFSLGAGIRTSSGDFFFGGLAGFNYFKPEALHYNRNIPRLVLTALQIANQPVLPGENEAIKEHISIAKELRVDYKQNFSLDFVALNYTVPQESRYFYMLEGLDKTWNSVGNKRTASFTNLYPGKYTFRVKAESEDGSWSTPPAAIEIYVKPPFYLTYYAYASYVLLAGLALWGLRHRGVRKLKAKLALEQERIQARQLVEQERRDAANQHEFDQNKIKFLTNLSHEFRTPISLILGPIETLLSSAEGREHGELNRIKRNARRLLNMVNQLLDFRKLEEHELKLSLAKADLVLFTRDVAESFRDIAERKRINFLFTSALSSFYTEFDADKMERILFNLLSNAFKFTAKQGDVFLSIESTTDGVAISIRDSGIGMTPEVQEKIFERFFQDDKNTDVLNQGSGIGLSITREFVRLQNGSISVKSIPGKGTTFTLVFPFEALSAPETAISEHPAETGPDQPANHSDDPELEKLTVLLIEDDDDFRAYLKENLRQYYRITEASDGKEGWQKALSGHPQVIVSDISMPYMNGIELCRKIKADKRTSHIPIILLTALTGDADQLNGLETGASDYLTKPFKFEILNIKIRNLLALNQNLRNAYSKQLRVVAPQVVVESENEKLMLKVAQFIETNLNSPKLSVEELSKHVGMSRGSLYNKIVDLTGETPVEYIRSVKLEKAAALLESGEMRIAQVGYAVGFATPNYFARAFKAKFNILPSEFAEGRKKVAG